MSAILVNYFHPVAIVITTALIRVMATWCLTRTPHMCVVNMDFVEQRTTHIVVLSLVFQLQEESPLKMENR